MNKSNIISLPNKSLRQRSKKIGLITGDIRQLAEDMQKATLSWEDSRQHELGVALAAVQVDRLLRIVIVRNNFDNKGDRGFQVYINPEITKAYGDIIEDYEGCLSVKNIYGKVPRYNKVKMKALNLDGQEIRLNAEGFLARVLQHEIDHTKGKVLIDHIKDKPNAFFELKDDGSLEPLDYEKEVENNSDLWE